MDLLFSGGTIVTMDPDRRVLEGDLLVRDGRIVRPIEEVTIAGNLETMFADVVAAGDDIDTRGNVHCGSLLLRRMMVAGS